MSATSAATHLTQSMNINQILASFLSARLVSTFWQWRKNAPPKHHTHSPRGKKEKKRKRKKPTTRTAIWDDGTVGPSDTGVPVFPKKEPSIPRKVRGRRSRSNKTQVKNTAADNNREAAPRKKERTKEKKEAICPRMRLRDNFKMILNSFLTSHRTVVLPPPPLLLEAWHPRASRRRDPSKCKQERMKRRRRRRRRKNQDLLWEKREKKKQESERCCSWHQEPWRPSASSLFTITQMSPWYFPFASSSSSSLLYVYVKNTQI